MRAGLIIAAVAAYVAVLGCVIFPSTTGGRAAANGNGDHRPFRSVPTGQPLTGLPYRGAAMQIQRTDWIEEYKQSIDEIADVGCDTVLFVIDARQENGDSTRIYLDLRMTPTVAQCNELIKHAKSRKLRVVLMPIVLIFAMVGAFAINNSLVGVTIALVAGVGSFLLQENEYPVAPLVLGMVIGTLLEQNFMQAMIARQGDFTAFFGRPIAAGLGILTILLWLGPVIAFIRRTRRARLATSANHA